MQALGIRAPRPANEKAAGRLARSPVPPGARCRGRTQPERAARHGSAPAPWLRPRAAGPAPAPPAPPPQPAVVLDHVPRGSGNQELPGSGSRAQPRQAPPTAADVKLSPYHYRASASRSGESRGFLRGSAATSGPRVGWNEGF